jgi:hypothetical protein
MLKKYLPASRAQEEKVVLVIGWLTGEFECLYLLYSLLQDVYRLNEKCFRTRNVLQLVLRMSRFSVAARMTLTCVVSRSCKQMINSSGRGVERIDKGTRVNGV